jgi:predicted flap endonuclease-1-like 5' DNA nuclease
MITSSHVREPAAQAPEHCVPEPLERPLFSSGMVLSDSDLTALQEWAGARLDLQRYRTGRGVVCGLDVRCRPGEPGWVTVAPGYAVAGSGQDVLVCRPLDHDLSAVCAGEPSCAEPPAAPANADPCGDAVVDLYLAPSEATSVVDLVDLCGCGGRCTHQQMLPTRVREGAQVVARVVTVPAADADAAAAVHRQESYSRCHDLVQTYVTENVAAGTARQQLAWLAATAPDFPGTRWLKADEGLGPPDVVPDAADVAVLLLAVALDRRLGELRAGCDPGPCPDDVRLARIWLRRPDQKAKNPRWTVIGIDAFPPYRRELAPPAPPVAPGATDLSPLVWQQWEQVCVRWRLLSAGAAPETVPLPDSVEALKTLLDETQQIAWQCGDPAPVPVLVQTECHGLRVLGFRPAPQIQAPQIQAPQIQAPPAQAPPAQAPPAPAPPAPAPPAPALTAIPSIGPARERALVAAGLDTVAAVAAASPADLAAALRIPEQQAGAIRTDARRLAGRKP